jgi:hypothetical protein
MLRYTGQEASVEHDLASTTLVVLDSCGEAPAGANYYRLQVGHASWDNVLHNILCCALRRACGSDGSALATLTRANDHVLAATSDAAVAAHSNQTFGAMRLPTSLG